MLGRVVRLDRVDHPPDPLHHASEVDLRLDRRQPELVGVPHPMGGRRAGDQALGGHAAGPQAVTPGPLALEQCHPGADCGGDLRRHQPAGTAAEDHQVIAAAHYSTGSRSGRRRFSATFSCGSSTEC